MKTMQWNFAAVAGLGLSLFAGAGHAQHEPHVVRITDATELAAGGHQPGEEVWKVLEQPDNRPLAQRIAEREQLELSGILPSDGARSTSVQGVDFVWLRDGAIGSTNGNFGQSCLAGSATGFADAHLPLPSDRRLAFFDVWTRDNSATGNLSVRLYATCSPTFAAGAPTQVLLSTIDTVDSPGNGFAFNTLDLPGEVTSNCSYFVRMIASECADGTALALQKVRVVW